MTDTVLSALRSLDVASLDRADWIMVGMALKEEGYPVGVWDEWSRNDTRYRPGECERLWKGFHGHASPVRAGSIVQLAKGHGWTPYGGENACLNWEDAIAYDGEDAGGDSSSSLPLKHCGASSPEGEAGNKEEFKTWSPVNDLMRWFPWPASF